MAGNTKLMGFSPDNSVSLSRWGKEVRVGITRESMVSLRDACADLPAQPPEVRDGGSEFKVRYDESVGRVLMDMDPSVAEALAQRVSASSTALFLLDEEAAKKTLSWVHHLRECVKAHEDYHNSEGEPGVEGIR